MRQEENQPGSMLRESREAIIPGGQSHRACSCMTEAASVCWV